MKYALFVAGLLAVYPFGTLLRRHPRYRLWVLTLLGLLPFLSAPDINLISYEDYRGDSRGLEVTVVDLLVLSLYVALPPARHPGPFRVARYAYLLAALVSMMLAPSPVFASLAIWKLVRMYLLLGVVTRACADIRVPPAILRGMMFGILCQVGATLFQRYALHVHQTPGFFSHQNSLGMAVNLVTPVALTLLFRGSWGWLPAVVTPSAAVVVVLSLSRGAIGALIGSTGIIFLVSVVRHLTPRTLVVTVAATVLAAGLVIKAGDTVVVRFTAAEEPDTPQGLADSRSAFNEAAALMLRDHPFGVGINQFSLVFVQGGYVDRVAPGWSGSESPTAPRPEYAGVAHNIYWLTLAEMGYLGFAPFLVLVLGPMFAAFRYGWRGRGSLRGDLLLGLGTGLLALNAQGLLEWGWRQTEVSYLFWMIMSIVAALARPADVGKHRARSRRRARPVPNAESYPHSPEV